MKKMSTAYIVIAFVVLLAGLNFIIANHSSKNLHVEFSDDDVYKSCVIDENGVFDNDQALLSDLNNMVKECARKNKLNLMVFLPDETKRYHSDDAIEEFTDRYYDQTFGEYTDGILYYIDISGKRPAYDVISKSGSASIIYTDAICQRIFNSLDKYLPSSYSSEPLDPDKLGMAIESFCQDITDLNSDRPRMSYYDDGDFYNRDYTYMKNGKTYITKSPPPAKKLPRLIFADLLGALVALIIFLVSKSRYKFKNKTNPRLYLNDGISSFSQVSDVFQGTHTTKTRIESSGGGGGGHRSGGGGGYHGGSHSHSGHHR